MVFKRLRNKKGFSLVELVLALAIIGIAGIGILVLYNTTVRPSAWINDKIQNFTNLQAALEQARTINGGRYPIAATAISNLGGALSGGSTTENILRAVIGVNNAAYTSWTYQCTAAGALTIGVYVGDETNTDRQNAVQRAISQNFTQWNCGTITSDVFTCTRSNVSCG